MSRVEEMQVVRATPAQAIGVLLEPSRMREWSAPDVTVTATRHTERLGPGDRFRVEAIAGPRFDYTVEAVTQREVVLRFEGTWCGEERWSFVADGDETIIRRTYIVEELGGLAGLAWRALGPALVLAHFKYELSRFRSLVERLPPVRAEIDPGTTRRPPAELGDSTDAGDAPRHERRGPTFPIDEG